MNWNTILASGVIAALISGVLSLIGSIATNKIDNKLKYITEERKNWRSKIRNICLMFDEGKDLNLILTDIKTNINTYGYEKSINELTRNCKDNEKAESDFFMTDGHIWRIINKLETLKDNSAKEIYVNQLKLYLCKLVKYDWDRSKQEVLGNRQTLYSWLLFAFGEISLIINVLYYKIFIVKVPAHSTREQCDILFQTFMYALMFFIPYFISNLPKVKILYNDAVSKKTVFGICGLSILILMIVISLINSKINVYTQLKWMIFPLLVEMLAVAVNCASQVKKFEAIKKYVDDIKTIDKSFWDRNNSKSNKN